MTVLEAPNVEGFLLVDFRYGDKGQPLWRLYTDSSSREPGQGKGDEYINVPSMEADPPKKTGFFKEKPLKLVLPEDDFLRNLAGGQLRSETTCWVREVLRAPGKADRQDLLYRGRVSRTVLNHQRAGRVLVEARDIKSRLDFPINQGSASIECINCLFEGKCGLGLNRSSFEVSAPIDAVDGREMTVTDAAVSGKEANWWRKGSVLVDGYSILIQAHSPTNPSRILLRSRAPTDWAGKAGVFIPGCDKQYDGDCAKFDNQDNFLAPGHTIPAYFPLLETGRGG